MNLPISIANPHNIGGLVASKIEVNCCHPSRVREVVSGEGI